MFWRIGHSLDLIQEMTARLYRTNLGSYLETDKMTMAGAAQKWVDDNPTAWQKWLQS